MYKLLTRFRPGPVAFLFIALVFSAHASNEDERSTKILIDREEELWQQVKKFAEEKESFSSITTRELRRWNKLMKGKAVGEQRTMMRMYQEIKSQRIEAPTEPDIRKYGDIEEVVVLGNLFDSYSLDPAEFSVQDILEMRGIRGFANKLYRDGKYGQAYPTLLELAKRGFKDAQSRLAYILLNGTDDVAKSNLRALGWLGVAAYRDTEPKFRELFNRYMREVPPEVRPIVRDVVDAYRYAYAHSDHISCSTNHPHNVGVVKRTYCEFKLEAMERACGQYECWANRVNIN